MSIVVVAEKPSVVRDIARVLGARSEAEGYLEGNGYTVTWALGDLVHFAEPDDYGPQWSGRWAACQLPMIPEQWRLKTERSTAKQFQVVKRLINDAGTEQIVCATDAGREGENIFRLIYEHARCKKPVQRLWVSSLTDEAIREGLRRLRPRSAYDDLGQAARARAQADWLVGMNLTRAYTVHNRVLCTIGRVQTPTLAMVVQRDAQIPSFRKNRPSMAGSSATSRSSVRPSMPLSSVTMLTGVWINWAFKLPWKPVRQRSARRPPDKANPCPIYPSRYILLLPKPAQGLRARPILSRFGIKRFAR